MFWSSLVFHKDKKQLTLFKKQGGFGLIELMVSISIMAIVSAVILSRQSSFNSAVLLRNQAYEVALQIRQIQLNAVSVSGNAGEFRSVLGVYIDTTTGVNDEYTLFRDTDLDGFYDVGEEYGAPGILDKRFEFREIRSGDSLTPTQVSIIFVRPNFDARFFDGSASELAPDTVEIDVALKGSNGTGPGYLRTIEVTSTGQIAVK